MTWWHNKKPFVIAEISGNHGGRFDQAVKLVEEAINAGASAIKLQTYKPETLTIDCNKPNFIVNEKGSPWFGRTLHDLYSEGMTKWEWHEKIYSICRSKNVFCFSTPFDETAVDFLEKLDTPFYKISSFEVTHIPLLERLRETSKPIIISTGMANLNEIGQAICTLRENDNTLPIAALKCTSQYPAPLENSNIITIKDIMNKFDIFSGISDHSPYPHPAYASVALGGHIVEKHIRLTNDNDSIDSSFSLTPKEFNELVEGCNKVHQSIGEISYGGSKADIKNKKYRRSIYACKDIIKGETFTKNNTRIVRPSYGLEPVYIKKLLGIKAKRNISKGEPIIKDDLK